MGLRGMDSVQTLPLTESLPWPNDVPSLDETHEANPTTLAYVW